MLTTKELTETYKNFNDQKIVKLAMNESKSLREDAIPILEDEIIRRNLDKKLLDWIKLERNFFRGAELQNLKNIIKLSECVECGTKKSHIKGFNIHHISALDTTFDANLIICEKCGKKMRNKSYLTTLTFGWLSIRSIFTVPFYFINELFSSFSREKMSEKIIDEFIFENTGLIREYGLERITDLIFQSNKIQVNPDEIDEQH